MRALSYAYGTNHFSQDIVLQDVLRHFWPQFEAHEADLTRFGSIAGREVYETVYHVDHDAPPVLVQHNLDGKRIDRARLSPSHLALLKALAFINRPPYEGDSWHHHFAYGYLIGDPGLYCVLTITQQVAYAIHKYAPEFAEWKEALLSGRAFGATWMTEVQGGSDLGANQTTARFDGEVWRLSGDKYFASGAGLTDYAIATARPEGAPSGPKGLALFLVPRLRKDGSLNFHVRRLKDKSATRAVPSGEVEFVDTEAFLIGDKHLGIYYTLENLTVSRLANAAGAMGIAQKALLEVMHRVRHRRSFGHALRDHALIRRDLTDFAVRHAGGLALTFQAVDLFDQAWHERPPYSPKYHIARLYTHLAKTRTADHAAHLTAMAMELFGGLGFLEEYAIARWHREALITPIWEGPSNIQALDFLETLIKLGSVDDVIDRIAAPLLGHDVPGGGDAVKRVRQEVAALRALPRPEAEWQSKSVLRTVADLAQAASLYRLAETAGERYEKLGQLYLSHFLDGQEYPSWALYDSSVWSWDLRA